MNKKDKKQCLHSFRSVYYGCEGEVECSICEKSVWDIYNKDDASKLIDEMLKT